GRVSFAHQTITEYLAAKELAVRYQASPQILREKLALTRWDQALFLALSLLSPRQAEAFFHDVVSVDFALALCAVKYLEVGRDDVVSKLLALIPERLKGVGVFEDQIEWLVESSLPISESHEPQLRALMKLGDRIGAAAVQRLVELKGLGVKEELLDALVESRSDYNYCCNGIAGALKPLAAPSDVWRVVALADSIAGEVTSDSDDNVAHGFTSGAAQFLAGLEIGLIRAVFLPSSEPGPVQEVRVRILCNLLWEHHSTPALELAGELLLRGVNKAATAISFIAGHGRKEGGLLSWASFRGEHVYRLIAISDDPEDGSWAITALQCVCSGRPDLAEIIRNRAAERSGLARAVLLYCAEPLEGKLIIDALEELVNMTPEERLHEPIHLLDQGRVNWAGSETLFVKVLMLRDAELALAVVNGFYGAGRERACALGKLEIGPIGWWLDWLLSERDEESRFFLRHRISWLFSWCLSEEARRDFVAEFNRPGSKYREILSRSILLAQNDLTTDDFSAEAISFLMAELGRAEMY